MEWESNTVFDEAIHTPDTDAGFLEGVEAGTWSSRIVEQFQGKGCCWLWREVIVMGNAHGGKSGSHGSKAILLSPRESGGAITLASLSPRASISSWTVESLAHQTAWRTELHSRTPPRVPFSVPDALATE